MPKNGDRRDIPTYVGEYRDGLYEGRGTLTFPDGRRYEGEFRAGEYHGHGVMAFPGGERFEGEFEDGNASGFGIVDFPDGARFEGKFKFIDNSVPCRWDGGENTGSGVYIDPEGNMHVAHWVMSRSGCDCSGESFESEYAILDIDKKVLPPGCGPRFAVEAVRHFHPDLVP